MLDSGDEICSARNASVAHTPDLKSEAERVVELEAFGVCVSTDGYTTPTEADPGWPSRAGFRLV
jgi:hypothetical protein